jgi:enoyl-CoA hydratase/carnithine racemase
VREIGPAATKELVMTCRPFDAEEARSLGLVNRVVPLDRLDAEVDALAGELSAKATLPIRATKRHVDAVTSAMIGKDRAWSDADALVTALYDPESRAAAVAYLDRLG